METASTTIVTSYLLHINKVYTKKVYLVSLATTFDPNIPSRLLELLIFQCYYLPSAFPLCSSTRLL